MISAYEIFPEFDTIIGIDEAGRGPIAGPVVVASVILKRGCDLLGLRDSKKLSSKKREFLFDQIKKKALHWKYWIIEPEVIDEMNILQATFLGMNMLIEPYLTHSHLVLIDGPFIPPVEHQTHCTLTMKSIIKGDNIYNCIAAASIVAKVIRDRIMTAYHELYPQYDFINNKGYPTKKHKAAVMIHGICPLHRKTFLPIKNYLLT